MVKGITSGLLLNYISYASGPTQTADEMFSTFSASLGGNGKTLSKDTVDAYIGKVENGSVYASDDKLKFLNSLSNNWKTLFGDKKEITSDDFTKAAGTFASIIAADSETNSIQEETESSKKAKENQQTFLDDLSVRAKQNTTKIINDYLEDLSARLDASLDGLSKNDLTNYLKSLLGGNSDDDDTGAEIGLVSSLLTDFDNLTGGTGRLKAIKMEAQYDEANPASVSSSDLESPIRIRA